MQGVALAAVPSDLCDYCPRGVHPDKPPVSIGTALQTVRIIASCSCSCAEMASKGLEAKTVGLKVKTTKFQVRTLDSSGQAYMSSADDLYTVASALLQREIRGAAASAPGGKLRLRLMGVKASSFRGQAGAPPLPGQATLDGFLAPQPAATASEAGVGGASATVAGQEAEGEEERNKEEEEVEVCVAKRDGDERLAGLEMEDLAASCETQPALIAFVSSPTPAQYPPREAAAVASSIFSPGGGPRVPPSQPARGTARQEFFGGCSSRGEGVGTEAVALEATCPVCCEQLGVISNAALNRHMDDCLGVCPPPPLPPPARGSSGGGFGTRRPKRAKVSKVAAAGIERFLTPRERT